MAAPLEQQRGSMRPAAPFQEAYSAQPGLSAADVAAIVRQELARGRGAQFQPQTERRTGKKGKVILASGLVAAIALSPVYSPLVKAGYDKIGNLFGIGEEQNDGENLTKIGDGSITVAGLPAHVDSSQVDQSVRIVDQINYNNLTDGFQNDLGAGTEAFFAEPGKLLLGSDGPVVPQSVIDGSNGAIDKINPLIQKKFTSGIPEYWDLPEGGFSVVSFGGGTITYGDTVMHFDQVEGRNYLVVLRGPNADNLQEVQGDGVRNDLNGTFMISDYVPAHAIAMNYDGNPAGGFISEGQLIQFIQDGHANNMAEGQNCGDNGCSEVRIAMLDVNTGAFAVANHVDVLGANTTPSPVTSLEPIYSNFAIRG
ncbi:MAG TPA: hypothetical protein VLF20_03215 [Patescibacteria group bacterium]|nr:hypothetical protein [Patescibacteria group bacterium]